MPEHSPSDSFLKLLTTIRKITDPKDGCPWDSVQDFRSLRSYMIEEAYEAAAAASEDNIEAFIEELGDVLLQVVLNGVIAENKKLFSISDIITGLDNKMQRRHPHVFSNSSARKPTTKELKSQWQTIKSQEGKSTDIADISDLPASLTAVKIGKCCPDFDWNNLSEVISQLQSEIDELKQAIETGKKPAIEEELGDTFFSLCQIARWLDVSPEVCTHLANRKFIKRYQKMLTTLEAKGLSLKNMTQKEKDAAWRLAKKNI